MKIEFCKENNTNKLIMNKLDRIEKLDWETIRSMLRYTFTDTEILRYHNSNTVILLRYQCIR